MDQQDFFITRGGDSSANRTFPSTGTRPLLNQERSGGLCLSEMLGEGRYVYTGTVEPADSPCRFWQPDSEKNHPECL